MIIRSVAGEGGICREGLGAIFGADASGAADQLEMFLHRLGVATDYRRYGIGDDEWRELIDLAFAGERGQNFIGARENLLAAAGSDKRVRMAVA
jgi:hypothetical protein